MNRKLLAGAGVVLLIAAFVYYYPMLFGNANDPHEGDQQRTELQKTIYTCPMHPSVRSDGPGACPVCGMSLVEQETGPEEIASAQNEHASGQHTTETRSAKAESHFVCPMHPSVRNTKPASCPVCGMALVEQAEEQSGGTTVPKTLSSVTLSPAEQVLANVKTIAVERMTLFKEVRAPGRIEISDARKMILTAKFPGRIEHLHVNFTGQPVRAGDPVADMYSPEAISAQEELLLALRLKRNVDPGNQGGPAGAETLYAHSRQKLVSWGFTEDQIKHLESTGSASRIVTVYSPITGTVTSRFVDPQQYIRQGEKMFDVSDLSSVWMVADIYEEDLSLIRPGQRISFRPATGGKSFEGTISFITPTVNMTSRTVSVRSEIGNPGSALLPGMFIDAMIKIPLAREISVPSSSVILTGDRKVVFVKSGNNTFTPRMVTTGHNAEGYVHIISGLKPGEIIAVSGGYLLDSESRLRGGMHD